MMTEQQLDELFPAGCDPYAAATTALFGKAIGLFGQPEGTVPQELRDFVKRVFMRVAARRDEPTLRRAASLFHEVGSSISADALLPTCHNEVLAAKMRGNQRSPDQIKKLTADGFELCVIALANMGAKDVTIHECGKLAFGEEPWAAKDDNVTKIPMQCTGTLVHDEFTPCPVHDRRSR